MTLYDAASSMCRRNSETLISIKASKGHVHSMTLNIASFHSQTRILKILISNEVFGVSGDAIAMRASLLNFLSVLGTEESLCTTIGYM
jgi:hypothetical protein